MQFSREYRSANIKFVSQISIPSTLFQNGKQFVAYFGCYLFSEYLWDIWFCSSSGVRKKKAKILTNTVTIEIVLSRVWRERGKGGAICYK